MCVIKALFTEAYLKIYLQLHLHLQIKNIFLKTNQAKLMIINTY